MAREEQMNKREFDRLKRRILKAFNGTSDPDPEKVQRANSEFSWAMDDAVQHCSEEQWEEIENWEAINPRRNDEAA